MIEWLDFYRPYFTESSDLEQFVQVCESLEVDDPRHRAKIMMHQGGGCYLSQIEWKSWNRGVNH
jgi:hypothetical protein